MSQLLQDLQWRYATKKFDTSRPLSPAQVDELLEAARLAASSYGLQAYRIAAVTDPKVREAVKGHAWGQAQVTDASHLLVFCAFTAIDEAYVDDYVSRIVEERGTTKEQLQGYRDMMVGAIKNMTPEHMAGWLKAQAYISLGFLLSQAAHMQIDACPMEGFDPVAVSKDLGLPSHLQAVALCTIGYRAADDATASYKKVRTPMEDFVLRIGA